MAKRKWWQWALYLLGPLGSVINNFVDRKNGTGIFGAETLNQLGSFVNSKTGAHLTGAQQEANEFSARMAEEEFARQEEFYLKYQSPKAMMRQGVNPFSINGSTGGQSVSGGAPSSVSPSAPQSSNLFDIVQLLFGMQQQKRLNDSQISLNESAVRRNDAESTEREINSESLREMNAADIMEKLSSVELNSANVKLITSKVLNTDADTDLKREQLRKVATEIINIDADTSVKAQQLNVMFAEIAHLEADTDLKRQQIQNLLHDILVEQKQIELFDAQIATLVTQQSVNHELARKLEAEWNKLKQDYSFDEIMNGFRQTIARAHANREAGYDPETYADSPLLRRLINVINFFERMFDFSASTRY